MIALAPLLLALQPLPRGPTPTRATQPAVPALFSKGAAAAAAAAVAASPLPAFANQAAAVAEATDTDGGLPIVGKFFETEEGRQVLVYLAQTVINWGVPASVALVFVLLTFKPPKSPEDGDEPPLPPQLAKALGLSKEPKEYLKIERLNAKLASFDYSFQKATVSKESALRASERQALERRFGAEVADMTLDSETVRAIAKAEEKFRKVDGQIAKDLEQATRKLRASSLSKKGNATAAAAGKADDEAEGGGGPMGLVKGMMPAGMMSGFANGELQKQVRMLQDKRLNNELAFLSALSAKLQPEQASKLAMALKPPASDLNADEPGGGSPSAVVALAGAAAATRAEAKHVYVLSFFGDVTASQVSTLRQEVTAVLRTVNVSRGDEVVLVLNTGGGTVTGYGLAAAQLGRLKNADVPLTICVEQVAASGGYMMACVADKILCAPFAVIGSIGVITEQPNVYERLKKEGVVFSTVTAGKYKRTLTPTKQLDPKDMAKLKDDIEQVLTLFKGFVAENRPQLDIATVATGETWLGPDALKNQLVDGLSTVDEVLTSHVDGGAEVYSVKYQEKPKSPLAALSGAGAGAQAGLLQRLLAAQLQPQGGLAATGWRGLAMALLAGLTEADAALGRLAADGTEAYSRQAMASRLPGEAEPLVRWEDEAAYGEAASEDDAPTWFM